MLLEQFRCISVWMILVIISLVHYFAWVYSRSVNNAYILFLEDDIATSKALTLLLEYEGYQVEPALSVKQAQDIIVRLGRPALVILDYYLTNETCEEFTKVLRHLFDGICIILCTAGSRSDYLSERCKADYLFKKPFQLDDFLSVIKLEYTVKHYTIAPSNT